MLLFATTKTKHIRQTTMVSWWHGSKKQKSVLYATPRRNARRRRNLAFNGSVLVWVYPRYKGDDDGDGGTMETHSCFRRLPPELEDPPMAGGAPISCVVGTVVSPGVTPVRRVLLEREFFEKTHRGVCEDRNTKIHVTNKQ